MLLTRAFKIIPAVAVLAVASALGLTSAASANDAVKLFTLQSGGFNGRLAVTGFTVGKVIHTKDGGQVFGFAINQNGSDGLLASAQDVAGGRVLASVQTFDQTTAKITKVVAIRRTHDDFVTNGIFGNDVGLVELERVVNNHVIRSFHTLNPVTGNMFTGIWTPPNGSKILVNQFAGNQTNGMAAVLAEDFSGNPFVFGSVVPSNTFGPVIKLDPNHFGGGDQPQLAQDTKHNSAVIATSPDGGAVGGQVPLIAIIDLVTGKMRQFNGVKIPPFNSGYVNGLAVDSATGIACTTTELDASVEFYNLANGTGFAVGLPGANGNQGVTGRSVASDPVHKLFLVAQPVGSIGPAGDSVVDIFDENGNLFKSITGFKSAFVPELVVNPAKRMGFINGPTVDSIIEFTY